MPATVAALHIIRMWRGAFLTRKNATSTTRQPLIWVFLFGFGLFGFWVVWVLGCLGRNLSQMPRTSLGRLGFGLVWVWVGLGLGDQTFWIGLVWVWVVWVWVDFVSNVWVFYDIPAVFGSVWVYFVGRVWVVYMKCLDLRLRII